MASYIANNENRDTVTITLSKAEADSLRYFAECGFDGEPPDDHVNPATTKAANRAMQALGASTNRSARRAGFFDT